MKKLKILMLGKPGGTLARTYNWHIQALNLDNKKRFDVDDINIVTSNFTKNIDVTKYDIFWFYAKAFNPSIYNQIKEIRPDAKIICGPNILLDKPDKGISDEWDKWYVNEANPDLHLDQVEFYSNHVKKFLNKEMSKKSLCIDKCISLNDDLYDAEKEKVYDCLIYSKKRRYDYNFEEFRSELLKNLDSNNIKYVELKAGKFGKYEREEYFKLLNQSRVTVNLSLDECPGILNFESMFFNVPVIGSKHNVPSTSCPELIVEDTDEMTEKYLVRKEKAANLYFKKIKWFLENKELIKTDHRQWVKNHASFERYANNVESLIKGLYNED